MRECRGQLTHSLYSTCYSPTGSLTGFKIVRNSSLASFHLHLPKQLSCLVHLQICRFRLAPPHWLPQQSIIIFTARLNTATVLFVGHIRSLSISPPRLHHQSRCPTASNLPNSVSARLGLPIPWSSVLSSRKMAFPSRLSTMCRCMPTNNRRC